MTNQIPGKKEVEGQLADKLGAELQLFVFGYLPKNIYIHTGRPKSNCQRNYWPKSGPVEPNFPMSITIGLDPAYLSLCRTKNQ